MNVVIHLDYVPVSYTHLRAHETEAELVCRLLLEKKKNLVDVFLRLRPKLGSKPEDETLVPATDVDVVATAPTDSHSFKMRERETKFTFSQVYPTSTTQEQIFNSVSQPLVDTLLNGGQGLLFAYGMTNAGKTYTIQGSEHNPGVLPRSLDKIFTSLQEKQSSSTCLLYTSPSPRDRG